MLFGWLTACLIPPEAVDARVDADGDGFAAVEFGGADCNDDDASVSPDADELCDELDRDCDGLPGNVDADGDGFAGCEECDDADAGINPTAQEVCDDLGVDEDCDGLVNDDDDSVDLSTGSAFWPDADGDGLGDVFSEQLFACDEGAGRAADNSDCNDDDRWVPMPREWCRNGVDDDCSGAVVDDSCRYAVQASVAEATFTGLPGEELGSGMGFVPDVDGDGAFDLAIGVPQRGPDQAGAVLVFSGGVRGEVDLTSPVATIEGARPGDQLGSRVVEVDWRRDGTRGLAVSSPGSSVGTGIGAVFLLDPPAPGVTKLTYGQPAIVGSSVGTDVYPAGLGTVRAAPEGLLVGFTLPLNPQNFIAGFEHAIQGTETIDDADWRRRLSSPYLAYDEAVLWQDYDGDGVSDLVVGQNNGSEIGISRGPFTGTSPMAFEGTYSSGLAEFGESIAATDLDGDGDVELFLTGRSFGGPAANHVLTVVGEFSAITGIPEQKWLFVGSAAEGTENHRQSVSASGDIDADGLNDVVWGQPEASRTWLIYSGFNEPTGSYRMEWLRDYTTHMAQVVAGSADTGFGRHVHMGPDVNGDGRDDLLISADRVAVDSANEQVNTVSLLWGGRW